VVVAAGLTACVPPLGCRVYELPSLPATVTVVALVAITVKVEELPAATDAGLASIATVGAGDLLPMLIPAHPASRRGRRSPGRMNNKRERLDWPMHACVTVFAFVFLAVDFSNVAIRRLNSEAD
jgi:hypothetical protein